MSVLSFEEVGSLILDELKLLRSDLQDELQQFTMCLIQNQKALKSDLINKCSSNFFHSFAAEKQNIFLPFHGLLEQLENNDFIVSESLCSIGNSMSDNLSPENQPSTKAINKSCSGIDANSEDNECKVSKINDRCIKAKNTHKEDPEVVKSIDLACTGKQAGVNNVAFELSVCNNINRSHKRKTGAVQIEEQNAVLNKTSSKNNNQNYSYLRCKEVHVDITKIKETDLLNEEKYDQPCSSSSTGKELLACKLSDKKIIDAIEEKKQVESHDAIKLRPRKQKNKAIWNEISSTTFLKAQTELVISRKNEKKLTQLHSHKKLLPCPFCNKHFMHQHGLRNHVKVHRHLKPPFSCSKCSKKFKIKSNLCYHMILHVDKHSFSCHICKKCFSSNWSLKRHLNLHSVRKKLFCSKCKKEFVTKYELKCHMRVHSKPVETFTCSICNRKISSRPNLVRHITNLHSSETLYTCPTCNKKFLLQDQLENHMKVHLTHTSPESKKCVSYQSPVSCPICHESFSNNFALSSHLRVHKHTGLKRYQCSKCSKMFMYKYLLRRHIKVHGDEL